MASSTPSSTPSVQALFIGPTANQPLQPVDQVVAVAGHGLEGDRKYRRAGKPPSKNGPDREITLIEAEAIEAVSRDYDVALSPIETRRNVVTRGIALEPSGRKAVPGWRGGPAGNPLMRTVRAPGVADARRRAAALVHRGGLRAQILEGGAIRIGDPIDPMRSLTDECEVVVVMTPEVSRSPLVGVVMGSKSDWETMRHAAEVLTELGVPVESKVVSAHRTPERLFQYGRDAEGRGLEVIIAGAGGAAHLPGMLAAISILPVLGVPVESKSLKGVDSLLSIVQMPRGVPVGTLAIGTSGAVNAGLLAAAILARKYPAVREALAASARLRPRPWESRRYELEPRHQRESGRRSGRARAGSSGSPSPGIAGRHRQRATGTDVRPGRAADGLPGGRPEHHRRRTRRPGGPLDGRSALPITFRPSAPSPTAAEAVTVEFENVSAPALRWLARRRIVRPGWRTVWTSQNRLREKSFLASNAIPHAPWRPVRTEVELDAGRADPRSSPDPENRQLGLRRQGAGAGHAGGRGGRRLGQPGPGCLRGRGLGRVRRRGLGGRGSRAGRQRGGLSGRPEPPRAAHPGHDGDAGPRGTDRRSRGPHAGPGRGPGAGHGRGPLRRVLPDGRAAAAGQRDRSPAAQLGAPDHRGRHR